jgi:peptidyl-prolyl cis-trans isomerase SDCCAG10
MTLDACPWLDRKHTIFGKVEGNTIYNLLKIGELETDKKTDRPICNPIPAIKRIEVTINPFEDIVPRNLTYKDKDIEAPDVPE